MLKRILAWILLIGFVFLIFNIIIFGYYLQLSIVIYLVIVFFFLLTNRKGSQNKVEKRPDDGIPGDGEDQDKNDDKKDGE